MKSTKQKLLIDVAQSGKSFRGMGLYSLDLMEAFAEHFDVICVVRRSEDVIDFVEKNNLRIKIVSINLPHIVIEQFIIPLLIIKFGIKRYITAGDSSSIIGVRLSKTTHLMHSIYHTMPYAIMSHSVKRILGKIYRRYSVKFSVKRFHNIITVSKFTKNEIMNYYKIFPNKIFILPNVLKFKIEKKCHKENRILFITGSDPQKNAKWAINTIIEQGLVDRFDAIDVVGISSNQEIGSTFHPSVKYHGYVKNKQLEKFYSRSRMVVLPSLHESFGVPIIEGLSKGCAICASDRGAFKEIGDNFCYYFDPQNKQTLYNAINKACGYVDQWMPRKNYLQKFSKKNFKQSIFKFLL